MTEPAMTQPPPERPKRRPAPKRGPCRICGRTDVIIAAAGLCWADYARSRRPTPPAPDPNLEPARQHTLSTIKAARRRLQTDITGQRRARTTLKTRARLAYADGLSYPQLVQVTGLPLGSIQALIPASLARRPGDPTNRAPADKLAAWTGPLSEAVDGLDTANDTVREDRALLRELLVAATDPAEAARVSVERIAEALGVSFGAVLRWRGGAHPKRRKQPAEETP